MFPAPEALSASVLQNRSSARAVTIFKYLARRILAISITVLAGVFITVAIANRTGMLDKAVRAQIEREITSLSHDPGFQGDLEVQRQRLEAARGLALSFWPKHLLYTLRALKLDWGQVQDQRKFLAWIESGSGLVRTLDSRTIILSKFPNTLLLSGTAFLLLALVGIPIALYLSRHEGGWLDRVTGILTPLSSVPSWVIGILLVVVFAVQLRLFPAGKMFDSIPPQSGWETARVVAHHLFLPVMAVVLSLVFQLVYSWRTYLLIYADEDYLILAKAKGLKRQAIDFHYILRPAFPYMLTSLAMTLVGFWQTTTALEYFYQWPGIGKLFVDAIPNFHSESMYLGDMTIVTGIVVLFAYLLGITVFVLELMVLIFDPRQRWASQNGSASLYQKGSDRWAAIHRRLRKPLFRKPEKVIPGDGERAPGRQGALRPGKAYRSIASDVRQAGLALLEGLIGAFGKICQARSGRLGLLLVGLLGLVSIWVLIYLPYDPVAREWTSSGFKENPSTAKLALPKWVNWFRDKDLPATIVLNGQGGRDLVQAGPEANGMTGTQIDFVFDYPYQDFPGEMALYLTADYQEKMPFVSLTWITPDGREIDLKGGAVTKSFTYPLAENIPVSRLVRTNQHLKQWVVTSGSQKTPEHMLLFADPESDAPRAINGRYHLRVDGLCFEASCDLQAQLVIFGLVEGWAGTDYLRRDLSVPLLWGIPFALLVGVVGAVMTSMIALVLAAAGAWLGGWVDYLLQRAAEINLILPVMAISVILYAYFNLSLWLIIGMIMLSTVMGSAVKSFRAAFLQEKAAGYIEAAMAYGASDWRIITRYLVRRIVPIVIPQMVMLIPSFIFLEATLAIFNISDVRYPTWGRMVYSALRYGAMYGSRYWVLQPLGLMLVTGLAFVLIGVALNRALIPQLKREP